MALKAISSVVLVWATASAQPALEDRVRDAMRLAAVGGGDAATTRQLYALEAALAPAFQALPKNAHGRLSPEHVQQALRQYFQSEHGWTLAGLEQDGAAAYDGEPPLAARAQHAAFAARGSRGLDLGDVAAVATIIETRVHDDLRALLLTAYETAGYDEDEVLTAAYLIDVLTMYLGLLTRGNRSLLEAVDSNRKIKSLATMPNVIAEWADGPFSFDNVAVASDSLLADFLNWQHGRCVTAKATLRGLSAGAAGPSLPSVYLHGQASGGVPFTQSAEYLRAIGALKEPQGEAPRLHIASYMQGPANCFTATADLSFCCPSDCNVHVARVQAAVKGPVASAAQLSVLIPGALVEAGAKVEIHGPGFATLLHRALPEDCPSPATPGSLSVARWSGGREEASAAELVHYVTKWVSEVPPSSDAEGGREQPQSAASVRPWRATVRVAVNLLIIGMVACWILKLMRNASAAFYAKDPADKTKKSRKAAKKSKAA